MAVGRADRWVVRWAGASAVVLALGITAVVPAGAQEAPVEPAPTAPAPIVADSPPSIADALGGELRSVTGTAKGGFDGDDTLDVTLSLENHTAAPIELVVPRGALFASDDPTHQIAVTAGPVKELAASVRPGVDPVVSLVPGTTTVQLRGFCAQQGDSGPNELVPMRLVGMADEPMPTVLANIVAQDAPTEVAQEAVWWVSDEATAKVPDALVPLLRGVDTKRFSANPRQVVPDEQYAPAWRADTPAVAPTIRARDDDGGPSLLIIGLVAVVAAGAVLLLVFARPGRTVAPVPVDGASPQGWYPDPRDVSASRFWDGAGWTDQTRPR
jgi:hypothetical protein